MPEQSRAVVRRGGPHHRVTTFLYDYIVHPLGLLGRGEQAILAGRGRDDGFRVCLTAGNLWREIS